jgi:hypothetical protein
LIGAMTMYPGVDAHLNSILQIPGSDDQPSLWPAFHAAHITYIAGYLNEVLPQNYRALTEQSLQVRQQVGDREGHRANVAQTWLYLKAHCLPNPL